MQTEIAVLGAGCFWCTEAVFSMLKGVQSVQSGYSGGFVANPTYEQVSEGTTGHAEVARIEFDPDVISFEELLRVYFSSHDPTSVNRQGNDVGEQYRSVIFYTTPQQHEKAEHYKSVLNRSEAFKEKPIVTVIEPLQEFYPAEEYHKKYFETHADAPYCQLVITPKLEKLHEKFSHLIEGSVR